MNIDEYTENYRRRLERRKQAIIKENQQRQAVIEKIKDCLRSSQIKATYYLFGSTAEGKAKPGSDIDIAADGITAKEYFILLNLLTEAIEDYFIDLRDITHKDNFFARRVREHGIKLNLNF